MVLELSLCYAGCGTTWVACYAAAGLVAGTVTGGIGAPAAALACNAVQSTCMTACTISSVTLWGWNPVAIVIIAGMAAVAMKEMDVTHQRGTRSRL